MGEHILEIIYLVASISFILSLKMLSSPDSARKGNLVGAFGMGLAIFGTIFLHKNEAGESIHNILWIVLAMLIGTVGGWLSAKKVKMTAMPQMVSLFNGMGGACAAVISLVEFSHHQLQPDEIMMSGFYLAVLLGLIIGSISFSGSMIAFGKLNGNINDGSFNKILPLRLQQVIRVIMILVMLALMGYIMMQPEPDKMMLYALLFLSLIYGIIFVMPIGGADMPVVISLLNSFTGMAAAFGGFLYSNQAMLTGGILVGSAGTILTILMCNAMNRSLLNVIIGAFGGGGVTSGKESGDKSVREISHNDAAVLLSYAKKVIIVPGYGLAVAQAQHTCHELEKLLEEKGVEVSYAIHPVAGRMPGHMNVLLAEADVTYDKLKEMDDINSEFSNTDVVMIIGANDVVNPAAKNDPSSPIYGMPILEVENAHNIIVMKRSMSAGYAGIENELFYNPKTRMLFGDAKSSLQRLNAEVKEV